jgi:hypothetical protein
MKQSGWNTFDTFHGRPILENWPLFGVDRVQKDKVPKSAFIHLTQSQVLIRRIKVKHE